MAEKMTQTLNIGAILANLKRDGLGAIEREALATDYYEALECIKAIGESRDPRFVLDDENRFVYANIAKWVVGDQTAKAQNPETGDPVPASLTKGIYIGGNTGSGKSWCLELNAILAEAVRARMKVRGVIEPLKWKNHRAFDIATYYSRYGEIDPFVGPTIIGIQDVGSEPAEAVYMGNRNDVIRQLLEQRGDNRHKITLITSNLTYADIEARYGDRVASRFYGMFNYYEIVGKDRRK